MAKSKKEMYAEVSNLVSQILAGNGVDAGVCAEVQKAIDLVLKPGTFGAKTDVESVVKRDSEGNITELMCSVAKVFLPASTDYFYEDKTGKSQFIGIDGKPLKRLSKQAEKVRKQHTALIAKETNKINQAVYAGEIDVETAKEKIAELNELKPDFSEVCA